MIIRTLDDIIGTDAEVTGGHWTSRRLLLKRDGMGYSLHDTVIYAGGVSKLWYANHLEAVYIIEGEGTLEIVESGEIIPLKPGTMYASDKHDRHVMRATTDIRCICVFNPPLTGRETHDERGTYPLLDD